MHIKIVTFWTLMPNVWLSYMNQYNLATTSAILRFGSNWGNTWLWVQFAKGQRHGADPFVLRVFAACQLLQIGKCANITVVWKLLPNVWFPSMNQCSLITTYAILRCCANLMQNQGYGTNVSNGQQIPACIGHSGPTLALEHTIIGQAYLVLCQSVQSPHLRLHVLDMQSEAEKDSMWTALGHGWTDSKCRSWL